MQLLKKIITKLIVQVLYIVACSRPSFKQLFPLQFLFIDINRVVIIFTDGYSHLLLFYFIYREKHSVVLDV